MAEQILAPDEEVTLEPGLHIPLGQPAIWWHVLDVDTEHMTALLLADEPVGTMYFDSGKKDTVWENSSVRAWLNTEFPGRFSPDELAAVTEYETEAAGRNGQPVTDRFFLLSEDEATRYLDMIAPAGGKPSPWWWLRTTGRFRDPRSGDTRAAYVQSGHIFRAAGGNIVSGMRCGVRPACRIDLLAPYFALRFLSGKPGTIRLRLPQLVIRGTHAVKAYSSAARMTVPEGITVLDCGCFRDNTRLQALTLPRSLQTIEDDAFRGCLQLKDLTMRFGRAIRLPGTDEHAVKKLPCGLIAVGTALLVPPGAEEITVPEGITKLEADCFRDMPHLRAVTLPESLQTIGALVFSGCESLGEVRLPPRAAASFPDLGREKAVRLWCALTAVGPGSSDTPFRFFGPGAEEITVPEGVTELKKDSFSSMPRLRSVTLPATLRKVGSGAFSSCPLLRTVTVRSSVIEWAANAFSDCGQLNIPRDWLYNTGRLPVAAIPGEKKLQPKELSFVILFQYGDSWNYRIMDNLLLCPDISQLVPVLCDVITSLPEEARQAVRHTGWVEWLLTEHPEAMTAESVNIFCGILTKQTLQGLIDRCARAQDTVLLPMLLQYRNTHPSGNDPLKDLTFD